MSTVIKVENLSKQYRLGLVGASTFKEDTQRLWARLLGKEDPFLLHGVENDRTISDNSKFVWSLKDINFDVKQGDVLGVIGRNGAGKSTLLKILSKVTAPTSGSVKVKGRIASLLEVGTGFHPELTGRENIFLNGAILGMRKHEIKNKFDEIINFAGVEKYVDTPVKRYSSGMYVRLAFAVAAHLENEILIIDEVLAVGDVEFQNKCLGKLNDVSKGDGRTVLFVSHNLSAVNNLCTKGILLENGILTYYGDNKTVIDHYINSGSKCDGVYNSQNTKVNDFNTIQILDCLGIIRNSFNFNESVTIKFVFNLEHSYISKTYIVFRVIDQRERIVFSSQRPLVNFKHDENYNFELLSTIPNYFLVPNTYRLIVALHIPNVTVISYLENIVSFNIEETGTDFHMYSGKDYGCVFADCIWK